MMRTSGEIVCVCGGVRGAIVKKKRCLYINKIKQYKMKSDSTSSRVLELKKKKKDLLIIILYLNFLL